MGKERKLVAFLSLSPDCCVALLVLPWVCLKFVIVVVPDHIHLLFLTGHLLLAHIMFEIKIK